jgi:hypothetical protein
LDRRWRAVLATTIADGADTRQFTQAVDPARAALTLASLMDGLAVQFALGDLDVGAEVMTETLIFAAEQMLGCNLSAHRSQVVEATS